VSIVYYIVKFTFQLKTGTDEKITPKVQVIYEKATKRFALSLKLEKEGCFHAVAFYNGFKLKNGDFHILVLNGESLIAWSIYKGFFS